MPAGDYPIPDPSSGVLPGQARAFDRSMFEAFLSTGITTERRLFAAMMMQGMLSNSAMCQKCNGSVGDWRKRARMLTEIANIHADALIAELDRADKQPESSDAE